MDHPKCKGLRPVAEFCFWTILQQKEKGFLGDLLSEHGTRSRGAPCARKRHQPAATTSQLGPQQRMVEDRKPFLQKMLVNTGRGEEPQD